MKRKWLKNLDGLEWFKNLKTALIDVVGFNRINVTPAEALKEDRGQIWRFWREFSNPSSQKLSSQLIWVMRDGKPVGGVDEQG